MSEEITLKWETAKVDGTKLTVALEGKVDKAWKQSFETTVSLLGKGEWGEVALNKQKVRVSDVEPGGEEKLRHFLESVVLQANASRGPDEDDAGDGVDAERADSDDDRRIEMTERFRSFAEEERQSR
jgi:hypothetical protein